MKRVLFLVVPSIRHDEIINMDSNSTWIKPHMPIGVLSIISYTLSKLNDDDDECVFKVVDLREYYYAADGDDEAIYNTQRNLELILDFDPDYIMLSALFNTCYFHIKYILDTIAKFKKKYLIFIGGGYATLYYKNILQEFELIDGVVIAEGEIAVADILANKISMWKKVSEKHSSIFTRDKLTKFIEPIPEFVNNLDEIPELDLTYINQRIYSDKHIAYSSSRGCPFNCIFCAAGVMAGKKIRKYSKDRVISDIRYFYKLGYRCFEFFDENFLFDKSRALSILSELCQIGDDLQLSFPSGVMVSRIDDEICALLQKLHVKEISLALESGSEHVLHDIIQKPVEKKDFLRAVDSLKKYNIDQRVFIVSGFPGETDLDRDITVNFLKNTGITWAAINIAMPLIGSRLYDWCLEKGYIVNHNDEMVAKWGTACIQTNEYSAEYLKEAIYCMNLDVNFLNNHEMLSGEIDKVIPRFEYIVNAYEKHAFAFLCLARCYYIKGDKYLCEINLKKAMDIMNDEQVWWQRIRKFNIDINSFVTGKSFLR